MTTKDHQVGSRGTATEIRTSQAPEGAPSATATTVHTAGARTGLGAWTLYGTTVIVGLAVSTSPLLTLLLGRGWPAVAVSASIALAVGLAMSGWAAPALHRRSAAMLVAGLGAGLMAGAVVLTVCAVLIVSS